MNKSMIDSLSLALYWAIALFLAAWIALTIVKSIQAEKLWLKTIDDEEAEELHYL